jgi:hypothetical protein
MRRVAVAARRTKLSSDELTQRRAGGALEAAAEALALTSLGVPVRTA